MRKIFIANWKENPKTEREAVALFRAAATVKTSKDANIVVCPPFVYLEKLAGVARSLKGKNRAALGAQDVFWENEGPYTGEISPAMLKDLGIGYVIIGHSERRRLGETDEMVNKKIRAAIASGLRAVLCVGESVNIREKGVPAARKFIKNQLAEDLKNIPFDKKTPSRLIVAYEPIWAIGTGRNAGPADARAMAVFIKKQTYLISRTSYLAFPVLYGGSVNGENIGGYMQFEEIDGALVGGASLKEDEWKKITASARWQL